LFLLPLLAALALRRRIASDIGELAMTCLLAVLANAFVCGVLSNPHDRYGARLVWLAVTSLAVAAFRFYEQREALPAPDVAPANS